MTKRKNGDKYTTSAWRSLQVAAWAYTDAYDTTHAPGGTDRKALLLDLLRKELDRAAVAWAEEQGGAK
jgi:hypothetical protein